MMCPPSNSRRRLPDPCGKQPVLRQRAPTGARQRCDRIGHKRSHHPARRPAAPYGAEQPRCRRPRRCRTRLLSDTGGHEVGASCGTRASTKAGLTSLPARVSQIANLGSREQSDLDECDRVLPRRPAWTGAIVWSPTRSRDARPQEDESDSCGPRQPDSRDWAIPNLRPELRRRVDPWQCRRARARSTRWPADGASGSTRSGRTGERRCLCPTPAVRGSSVPWPLQRQTRHEARDPVEHLRVAALHRRRRPVASVEMVCSNGIGNARRPSRVAPAAQKPHVCRRSGCRRKDVRPVPTRLVPASVQAERD